MDMKAIRALAEIMKANDLTQVETGNSRCPGPGPDPICAGDASACCCTGIRSFPRDTAAGRGH